MTDTSLASSIAKDLQDAASVAVVLPPSPEPHIVGAGLSLFLALEGSGKRVDIACPTLMLVEANRFVGVQHIAPKLSGRNLVLSFDYLKDAIEKVSYNVENDKFNLVITPKPGHAPLNHEGVTYSYSGTLGDVVVLVGSSDVNVTQELLGNGETLADRKILTVSPAPNGSLCSEIARIIAILGVTPDIDTVNNLFHALLLETQQFIRASASDFETAAALVRAGATIPQPHREEQQEEDSSHDWLRPKIFSSRTMSPST